MAAGELFLRVVGRGVSKGWNALRHGAVPGLTAPLGRLRNPRQIVDAWPTGEIPLGADVALFAHFDSAGMVRPHVLHYLASLAEAGLSVVLVSNAGCLQSASLQACKKVCAAILVRRNVGYDFGAWRDALLQLDLPHGNTRSVTLVNDSVYGPLAPLAPLLEQLDLQQADGWGLTDSWQRRYHLQSYFMRFGRAVIDSSAWRQFWLGVRPVPSKHSIIRRYEIGLTQALLQAGFRCRALWPYSDLLDRIASPDAAWSGRPGDDPIPAVRMRHLQQRRILEAAGSRTPLNPTSDLWRQLIEARYPFIKRELLRDNPTRVADLADWRSTVRQTFDARIDAIDRDLERILRHRSP